MSGSSLNTRIPTVLAIELALTSNPPVPQNYCDNSKAASPIWKVTSDNQSARYLVVGLDGKRFIFVRFRDKAWAAEEPVEISPESATRFLWALFNLEAESFFSEWRSLFEMFAGYDTVRSKEKLTKLAELYNISTSLINPPALLFAVHTYYAVFMKFLAAEIISFFHKLPSPTQRILKASNKAKFQDEINELERGALFRHFNITNFLEGDLFSWYATSLNTEIEDGLRTLVRKLDEYNPGTLSEEPGRSQDLLKDLYLQIMPREVRHDLGEYYTPDWVADLIFDQIKFSGDADRRVLDPACGSGTFLVAAINKIRSRYQANREEMKFDEGTLLKKILANVVGFDLNPLAVLAARANYLIAVRDLLSYVDSIEIPIYLCD